MKRIIQKGETLSGIASQLGVDIDKLLELNPQIKNRDLIMAGSTINIPEKNVPIGPSTNQAVITSGPARDQFESDKEKLNRMVKMATEVSPEESSLINIRTANPLLQSLAQKVGQLVTKFREQGGTLTPELETLIKQINNNELIKAANLAKAQNASDKGDAKGTRDAMEKFDKAEEEQQIAIQQLTDQLSKAREMFLETLQPTEREKELKEKLNTLRTERQLLPLELRKEGISAEGIKAGQIEDERVRAIQEQNLLLELGLEQEARQAKQKFAETKMGYIQHDIDVQRKVEEEIRKEERSVIEDARNLRKDALRAMSDIVSSLEDLEGLALAWEDLDPETQAEIMEMAKDFGIPINTLATALKVAKHQKVFDQSVKKKQEVEGENIPQSATIVADQLLQTMTPDEAKKVVAFGKVKVNGQTITFSSKEREDIIKAINERAKNLPEQTTKSLDKPLELSLAREFIQAHPDASEQELRDAILRDSETLTNDDLDQLFLETEEKEEKGGFIMKLLRKIRGIF